ncbi:RagB/SusD family nutrient uptake outer membrane protein [Arcticibacterium luteifluviistationis]|uniref:RagB/SusD family nutrient uptake outer membrane protein n=1 Tax=Arcticibacterium luteifluviistationis TaxID=1784714 RepID=A0A2Z4GFP0_9BACT|nr:RagB/SusD family nutrient uptake outer membrane protein [Arcticibacterium luteifluviistationis]AWW00213.1 RagB/SusD family nutrient uptake outer membrane protein [Arcticibacterium luteifluviistationis]
MKFQIKYTILIGLCLLMSISSCDKEWVDTKPNGASTTAYFWDSEDDVIKGIAAIYVPFRWESTWGRDLFWMQNASDDLVVGRSKADAENIKNFIPTGNEGYMATAFEDMYWMMNKANQAIEGVQGATNISEELRQRSLGEAYFIRAFSHFWAAYLWGHKDQGVPYDGVENEGFGERIPPQLASVTDNYAQIISDLEKAADLLPLFQTYGGEDQGRAHKSAAWAYMVKTYAYWAQYDDSKWEKVPALADKIKNEGQRALVTGQESNEANYRAVFTDGQNWGPEYIWSVTSGIQGGSEFPGVILENKGWGVFNGWGYFQPTEELYQEYEENDPRREVTILKFGDKFTYFGVEREYYSTNSLSGFQINKYMDPYSYGTNEDAGTNSKINQSGNYPTTALNLSLIRYAEILLFKAEALIQMGKSSEAADPLNEVRARVGLSPISSPTMDDLKHERRVELACEWTDRLADLKRWGDVDVINAPLHGRIHENKTDPNSSFTVEEVWPARSFNPAKHMAWPLSSNELSRSNGVYKQTPGW